MDTNEEKIYRLLQERKNVFLTGGAGVGKTTMTKAVIKRFEADAKKVAKLASTGMAATLIGGQTLHSFFDFGIASDVAELEKNGKYAIAKKVKKLIASMDLIVIDEISMVSASLIDMIAMRLKQAEFCGGVLFVGDFLQLPPVTRGSSEVSFAFESEAWEAFDVKRVVLEHIYRTDDVAFIELLNRVRFGVVDEDLHNRLNEYIKPLPADLSSFTFLFGKNSSTQRHNKEQLQAIEGEAFVKEAQIVVHKKSLKEQAVKRFMDDARIEEQLYLKVGAPVLFTKNSWNYTNGERGVVVNYDERYIYVQKHSGFVVKLEATPQHKSSWVERSIKGHKEMCEEIELSVYQFPLRLAFAITIHKSQGMSIENLIIETNEIFAPSQFYVALSRSCNPKNLILIAPRGQWYERIYVNQKAMAFVKEEYARCKNI